MHDFVELKLGKQSLSFDPDEDNPSKLFLMKSLADALNNIGLINFNKGNYSKALKFYKKSLKLSEEIDYKLGIAASFHNIAFLHQNRGEIHKALEYYHKSLKINEESKDSMGIAHSINNIALVHNEKGDYVMSLKYYRKSFSLWKSFGYKRGIAHTLNRIGNIYEAQESIDEALDYYFRSLRLWEEIDNKKGIAQTLVSIGNIYFSQNNDTKAKIYAERSMEITNATGFPFSIRGSAKLLSQIYEKEGRWKKAFKMQSLYIIIIIMKDSLRNEETEKDVIRQQANYEMEKKEQEILLLSTQNKVLEKEKEVQDLKLNKNRLIFFLIAEAFGLIVVLVIAVLRDSKKKQLINELLEKQKEHFRIQNQEKAIMMKEIHHRVKNNLQIVNSLLKFQSCEVEDEKNVAMFEETQNRILSMAHLHEKLYQSEDLKHVDVQEHFTSLVNDLVRDYEVGIDIDLDIHIEHVDLGIKTLVPLGLIINELITSALKYAFKEKKEGIITIHLKQLDRLKHELIIGDNGVGMDKDFNVKEASSLGTQLVEIFVEQLEGTMERLDQPGTVYKIVFERIDKFK